VRKVQDNAVIGCVGEITHATRGQAGPGEAHVQVRGGSETFTAWSEEPLARGTRILVVESRGLRAVDVVVFPEPDPLDALLDL
jgi:membrane protein implicated in regulation of membrane protease activity